MIELHYHLKYGRKIYYLKVNIWATFLLFSTTAVHRDLFLNFNKQLSSVMNSITVLLKEQLKRLLLPPV